MNLHMIKSKLWPETASVNNNNNNCTPFLFRSELIIVSFAGGVSSPHTPNTMMEKKSVDDLFRRLMQVGIIKVTPESGSESPCHAPSHVPPQAELQQPLPPPVKPVTSVLPLLNAVMSKKELSVEKKPIPVIKLVPEELKR